MLELPGNIRSLNPQSNLDFDYGIYNSREEALNTIVGPMRKKGKTVGIINGENGGVEEWWWKFGISDEDLILKISSTTYNGIAERNVGGIEEGDVFEDATMVEMWNKLIKQEKFPTLTNPSHNFSSNSTGLREVGEIINTINFTSTFSRGSINPQYGSDSPFRSGLPTEYIYEGIGLTNQLTNELDNIQTLNNYEVVLNNQTWRNRVSYSEGPQPKSSYGNDYESPLSAGMTSFISRTITGVYPIFATTSSINDFTKQPLQHHGTPIIVDMVAESGINKQILEFPTIWGEYNQLEQFNTLSGQFDIIDDRTFTSNPIVKNINGYNINYIQLIHNGSLILDRRLRFSFTQF